MKTCGHVVLEKARAGETDAALLVCGDLPEAAGPESTPVTGEFKGKIATAFAGDFISGVSGYGEDYLQAAVMGYSMVPTGETPLFGPAAEFGSGCAGILSAGSNAYVYVTEGSGMCIVRMADIFGKKKLVRCLSSEGGEDVIGLSEGSVLIACPERWMEGGPSLNDMISLFDPSDIKDDDAFDRHLSELAGEGFTGCAAALMVK